MDSRKLELLTEFRLLLLRFFRKFNFIVSLCWKITSRRWVPDSGDWRDGLHFLLFNSSLPSPWQLSKTFLPSQVATKFSLQTPSWYPQHPLSPSHFDLSPRVTETKLDAQLRRDPPFLLQRRSGRLTVGEITRLTVLLSAPELVAFALPKHWPLSTEMLQGMWWWQRLGIEWEVILSRWKRTAFFGKKVRTASSLRTPWSPWWYVFSSRIFFLPVFVMQYFYALCSIQGFSFYKLIAL